MKRITSAKEIVEQPDGTVFNVYIQDMDMNIVGEVSSYTLIAPGEPSLVFMGNLEDDLRYHYAVNPSRDVVYILDVIQ